jgi:glycosyltransferase involved in cell wall biosynthesis
MCKDLLYKRWQYVQLLERFIQDEDKELPAPDLVNLCQYAASFACHNHAGVFTSPVIEAALLKIARQIKVPFGPFKPNTILHVMTQAYLEGGHTRLVENWVSFPAEDRNHSVVITHHGESEIPLRLAEEVRKRNGDVFRLNAHHPLRKAVDLKQLAGNYELIVLHTHPFDVATLLAFGNEDFKRPVLISNHADHVFWLGVSICDTLLDMSSRGQDISRRKRRIGESHVLPIPVELTAGPGNRLEARERLGLPTDKKIVLSVGQQSKYTIAGKFNFPEMATALVQQCPNCLFIVVGPDSTIPVWQTAHHASKGKVLPVGRVPHDRLIDFFRSADVYVDSFPVGGGTACIEALMYGLPLISVDSGLTQFDSYSRYWVRLDDVIPRCREYLEEGRRHDAGEAVDCIRPHLRDDWSSKLTKVLRQVPAEHGIRPPPPRPIDFDGYDERLAAFCSVDLQAHEMSLIQSLSRETQARYLSLMIHHNPLVPRKLTVGVSHQ